MDSLQQGGILTLLLLSSEIVFDTWNLYKRLSFRTTWHKKAEILFYDLNQHFVNLHNTKDCDESNSEMDMCCKYVFYRNVVRFLPGLTLRLSAGLLIRITAAQIHELQWHWMLMLGCVKKMRWTPGHYLIYLIYIVKSRSTLLIRA